MPDSAIEYFHSVVPSTPPSLRQHLLALPHETVHAVDALLRFVLNAPCPPAAAADVHDTWDQAQHEASWRIDQLRNPLPSSSHLKRAHDDVSPGPSNAAAKRVKTDSTAPEDDPPLFTLHALSLTSPIRKKADITVHERTLRLTSGPACTPEAPPIRLAALKRAFFLPTRGKSKPHWTVLLLPSDVPIAAGKAGAEARAASPGPPVVFGVDAVPAAALSTSTYAAQGQPQTTVHPKGTPAEPALRTFLRHLPATALEPRTDVFRSAGGAGEAGVEAYRGAKPGTLWFLREGVLWDGRPAEFFALADLAPVEAAETGDVEGVRTISATGRTCSVLVRRVEDGEEGTVAEVDFGMVDGREQEGIARWVRAHRHLFGMREGAGGNGSGPSAAAAAEEDSEDGEDADFVASDSDDGSATSDSDDDGSGAETVDDAEGDAEDGDATDEEEGGEEEGALDPARHPLLRPGAMPKHMSRAAMEMVVGIVEGSLLGGGGGGEDEEEADELED